MIESIYFVIGLIFGLLAAYITIKLRQKNDQTWQSMLMEASEKLINIANEKFALHKEEIKTDLSHKKELIDNRLDEIGRYLIKADDYLRQKDKAQLEAYTLIKKEMDNYAQIAKDLHGSTEDLKRLLSNDRLRGIFGEQIAEELLRIAGFVIGQDYLVNQSTETTQNRPDFTIILSDNHC